MFNKVKIPTVFIVLLIFGIFLRFYHLGHPSFWVDEVNYVYAAQSVIQQGQPVLPSGYVYTRAPIYTMITSLFFRIFRVSEASTRLPAAIFGLLSIGMGYLLATRSFDKKVGLWVIFFMTFSHFEVGWSRTARMYTLLQFFTLAALYSFMRAIDGIDKIQIIFRSDGPRSRISQWLHQIRKFGTRPILWSVFMLILIVVAFQYIHFLIIFMMIGIFFAIGFIALGLWVGDCRFLNRYMIMTIIGLILAGLVWILYPKLGRMTQFFLSYTPSWAEGGTKIQNPQTLFYFLIEPYRFPLALFFILGAIQVLFKFHKKGIFFLFTFFFPFFFLSFVFTHRIPVYLFNVYPLFLIVAAYGVTNLLNSETQITRELIQHGNIQRKSLSRWFEKRMPWLFLCTFLAIFLLSPWFRISIKIPFKKDGQFNMAVKYNEWKEAVSIIHAHRKPDDVMITSIPLLIRYYGLHADYTLNNSLLMQAIELNVKNERGEWKDNYAGIRCINDLEQLKSIVESTTRGWIILEKYQFEHTQYVPTDIREYIENRLSRSFQTQRNTVLIYSWNREGSEQE